MSAKQQKVVEQHGKPLRDVLEEYYNRYGNQKEAANALGVSQGTFSLWLRLEGLEISQNRSLGLRVTDKGRQALVVEY